MKSEDSSIESEDASLENEDSSLENEDSSLENEDSSLEHEESSIENEDSSRENKNSGALQTSAWNTLAHGRKWWVLIEPTVAKDIVEPEDLLLVSAPEGISVNHLARNRPILWRFVY